MGRTVILGILSLFFELAAFAAPADFEFYQYMYRFADNRPVANGAFAMPVPHVADLIKDQNQFPTYPEFLDYLFAKAPALQTRFVLLHHSASLQLASPEFPRVILFEGGVTFAISEHPENRERKVEMLEVSPVTYEVKASEIRFTAKGAEIQENPKSCAACHGQPAKLLWDNYDFWPQAFGTAIGMYRTQQEADAYENLKASAQKSEIVKRLKLENKIALLHEQATALTEFVSQLNLPAWVRQNLPLNDPGGWKWPLLSALGACNSPTLGVEPEKTRSQFLTLFRPEEQTEVAKVYDRIYADARAARTHFKKFQDNLVAEFFQKPLFVYNMDHERLAQDISDITMIRTALEMMGVNTNNMSTSPFANDIFITSPSNILVDLNTILLAERPDWYKDVKYSANSYDPSTLLWALNDCASVKEQSLKATRSLRPSGIWSDFRTDHPERPVVNRCAKCHSEGWNTKAPVIPFQNSLKLAQLLRDPRAGWIENIMDRVRRRDGKQMPPPPAKPLTETEIESLQEFLQAMQ